MCRIAVLNLKVSYFTKLMPIKTNNTIQDLTVQEISEQKNKIIQANLPTKWGDFTLYALEKNSDGKEHVGIGMGSLISVNTSNSPTPVLVRLHSECLTGDAFSSLRCDCGPQLDTALEKIAKEGRGLVLYLRQ